MLPAERWERVKELFADASELVDEPAREGFLEGLAGADRELVPEVRSLLDAAHEEGGRLERAMAAERDAVGESWRGQRLGAWRIVERLGKGGMGEVFLAERADGEVEQRAALKRMRGLVATEADRARFRRERQLLATLAHPNVARLLDAGTAEDGTPYFVLEAIEGEPIDRWCDARGLGIEARVDLFREVCAAVEHCHRNLVVHRDLKPANVLVTPEGVPKLLDFGISKLLDLGADPADGTVGAEVVATPAYASPEQLAGGAVGPVGVASDVYSLGVVLYELLVGALPLRPEAGETLTAWSERVRTTRPQAPSERVLRDDAARSGSVRRGATPERLARRLAGDLDTILLTALRKEPERRYASVEALSEDLRRFRADLPIAARPDTRGYRARKFVVRHAVGVAASTALALALAAGLASTLWQARRAEIQASRAEIERAKAERVRDLLVEMLQSANPWRPGGPDLRVRDLLADASARLASAPEEDPEVAAALHQAIGESYAGLREAAPARRELERARELRLGALGPDAPATLESELALADLDATEGALEPAVERARRIIARLDATGESARSPMLAARAHGALGRFLSAEGEIAAAEREHETALALAKSVGDDATIAEQTNELALIAAGQGKFELAIERLEAALAASREVYGEEHPNIAVGLTNLAQFEAELGRLDRADELFARALALRKKLLGPESADVAPALAGYAQLLIEKGEGARAEALAREGLALRGRTLPDEHPFVPVLLQTLADARALQGHPEEALAPLEESLAVRRRNLPADSWLLGSSESRLGEALVRVGRRDEGERLLRSGLAAIERALGNENPRAVEARERLARAIGT